MVLSSEWGVMGNVASWLEEMAHFEDLTPEDMTSEEAEQLPMLRLATLENLGWAEPPDDWRAHYFQRCALLRFLRGRDGHLKNAVVMLTECIQWADEFGFVEKMAEYESGTLAGGSAYAAFEQLFRAYLPVALYGRDRRGASVLYLKHAMIDVDGLWRETSWDFYCRRELYGAGFFWSTLYNESLEANQWLMGRIFVSDLSGVSWKRALRGMHVGQKLKSVMVDHFPEGAKVIFVCNVPWYFSALWKMAKPLFPARTQSKLRIFRRGEHARFLRELSECVSLDQVPEFLGGEGAPGPWEAGEGGDVPVVRGSADEGAP